MRIKYFGHSCFSVHTGGKELLFDPFITGNPLVENTDISNIKADYILLSHAHADHSSDALAIAKNTDAKIIGIWEISEWAIRNGHSNTHPMNIGGFRDFDFGQLQMVHAVHSSSFPDGSYGGQAAGFVIKSEGKTFYYSGDTALTLDMQLIPLRHQLDFAFFPIGSNFTMDVEDAIKAADFVKCDKVLGMHYDTFGYILVDHQKAAARFTAAGKELTLMNIGQTIEI